MNPLAGRYVSYEKAEKERVSMFLCERTGCLSVEEYYEYLEDASNTSVEEVTLYTPSATSQYPFSLFNISI